MTRPLEKSQTDICQTLSSLRNERGSSVVEVMFTIVIFMIIMLGGLNYCTLPQAMNARQKVKRLAVSTAKERMETLLSLGLTGVVTDSNETNTPVTPWRG